jgi:coenzyme F420-0:L-glutamate ligase/coenzyme F420-1:gamma-L-glutamate ligase
LAGLPLVASGDDLAGCLARGLRRASLSPEHGDVLVVAQKVVSKAEGREVALHAVAPGREAVRLAAIVRKDARLVEVVLQESVRVVRAAPGVLLVETHHGFVCANAGVDHSNTPPGTVLRLPVDPDASAARLRDALGRVFGTSPAVIIADSHGRAWRLGTVGVAIGAAGVDALWDLRGRLDLYGRALEATVTGRVDELAAAATLVMGEAAEGIPAALIRGVRFSTDHTEGVATLRRPAAQDLFR